MARRHPKSWKCWGGGVPWDREVVLPQRKILCGKTPFLWREYLGFVCAFSLFLLVYESLHTKGLGLKALEELTTKNRFRCGKTTPVAGGSYHRGAYHKTQKGLDWAVLGLEWSALNPKRIRTVRSKSKRAYTGPF